MTRYHRQILLPQFGDAGQTRLAAGRVLLVGCGALGSVIAEQLVRGGVGWVRVADRDLVELTNLQRQVLFDEHDADQQTPKAVAAARRLRETNSDVHVEPVVTDVHSGNVERLAYFEGRPVDLILDGTDNSETRYLINDVSAKHRIPWVYGGCVGTEGRCLTVQVPGTPCLRCIFPDPPASGELPTCDTAGVLAPAAAVVASMQVIAAFKLLLGAAPPAELWSADLWSGRFQTVSLAEARDPECPCCGRGRYEFLSRRSGGSTSLCGRNAVQILPGSESSLSLADMAGVLARVGKVEQTPYLVRCALAEPAGTQLTVFPDGRAIVSGTNDPGRARSIYARFVGS